MWNPNSYLRFGTQRLRPALDLLAQLTPYMTGPDGPPSSLIRVLDIGCGTGNIWPHLHAAFPDAPVEIVGVDASDSMLSCTDSLLGTGVLGDMANQGDLAAAVGGEPVDIVWSNSALHWVPDPDQASALVSWMSPEILKPGGVVAVQLPDTRVQPSHVLMYETLAADDAFAPARNVRIPTTSAGAADWAATLTAAGAENVNTWATEFVQPLPVPQGGPDGALADPTDHPVVGYTRETGLKPVLNALGGEGDGGLADAFLESYARAIAHAYPLPTQDDPSNNGCLYFPFRRVFMVANAPPPGQDPQA